MEVFENLTLKDSCMVGYLHLPGSVKVPVTFDLDEEKAPDQSDFKALISAATTWARGLSLQTIKTLKKEIARELTDAAYAESDYLPSESDYTDLENSLRIIHLCFSPDNVTMMILESETEYPDMEIYCQLDDSYQLEDISVGEKN